MKPLYRVLVAVVAVVGAASTVAAQTPGLLNRLEVQKLVATDTPEANASLAAHFTALADRYTADAARHKGMAQAYSAHSNRSAVTNGRTHCERLAALAAESGSAAREMATYHRDLADGRAAATPKGAGAFQSGKGAPEPNAEQLHHLGHTRHAVLGERAADYRLLRVKQRQVQAPHVADLRLDVVGREGGREVGDML